MTEQVTEQEAATNEKWLEERAKDIGVSVEELRRLQRWDDLLLIQLEYRYPLEGRDGFRACNEAVEKLDLLAEAALWQDLFGDDPVMKMLLRDASHRARAMRERLRDEIGEEIDEEGEGR